MKKVLLVDDVEISNFIMIKMIEKHAPACMILDFTDPVAAFSSLDDYQPDVIFLDLNMPEMDGWKFLQNMQKEGKGYKVYVLTSSTSELDIQQASVYANVEKFLIKPTKEEEIASILSKL